MDNNKLPGRPLALRDAARWLASTLVVGLVALCATLAVLRLYEITAYAQRHAPRPPAAVAVAEQPPA